MVSWSPQADVPSANTWIASITLLSAEQTQWSALPSRNANSQRRRRRLHLHLLLRLLHLLVPFSVSIPCQSQVANGSGKWQVASGKRQTASFKSNQIQNAAQIPKPKAAIAPLQLLHRCFDSITSHMCALQITRRLLKGQPAPAAETESAWATHRIATYLRIGESEHRTMPNGLEQFALSTINLAIRLIAYSAIVHSPLPHPPLPRNQVDIH